MADQSDGEEIVEDTTGLIVETREGRFEVGPYCDAARRASSIGAGGRSLPRDPGSTPFLSWRAPRRKKGRWRARSMSTVY